MWMQSFVIFSIVSAHTLGIIFIGKYFDVSGIQLHMALNKMVIQCIWDAAFSYVWIIFIIILLRGVSTITFSTIRYILTFLFCFPFPTDLMDIMTHFNKPERRGKLIVSVRVPSSSNRSWPLIWRHYANDDTITTVNSLWPLASVNWVIIGSCHVKGFTINHRSTEMGKDSIGGLYYNSWGLF